MTTELHDTFAFLVATSALLVAAFFIPRNWERRFAQLVACALIGVILLTCVGGIGIVRFAHGLSVFISGVGLVAAGYFLPSLIAWRRNHRNLGSVMALNAMLGWTLIGWVAALVWSLYVERHPGVG
jgi:Superinfection immunity protein